MNQYQRDYMADLQYKVQALTRKLQFFESDTHYLKLKGKHRAEIRSLLSNIKRLEAKLMAANKQIATQYKNWLDVFDDVETEHRKQLNEKDKTIAALQSEIEKRDAKISDLKETLKSRTAQHAELSMRVEKSEGMCQKLHAQISRDFQNSSIPSSMSMNKKKISNSREKSGKRPGAQPGHFGHRRKTHTPTEIRSIEPPVKFLDETRYVRTKEEACRQVLELRLQVDVIEYRTPIFRDKRSGKRVHAAFPDHVVNEVNYGASVKSFCLLLNQDCNVSLDKTQRFLSDLTDGQLKPSKGMLNGLAKVFAKKSQNLEDLRFTELVAAPVLHTDFTVARVNGENKQVLICATPEQSIYLPRAKKGHEGIKDSPVELSNGTLIHDHDITFYRYGKQHQECLAHVLRYLTNSQDNESHLTWNKQMAYLLRRAIAYRNRLDDKPVDPDWLGALLDEYDEWLAIGYKEYEHDPPTKYYMEGYNLLKRLEKYKDNHLLFLCDLRVSATNNLAERLGRTFKRKLKQVGTFRSDGGLASHCAFLGHLTSMRTSGANLFRDVVLRFETPTCEQ